uniref:Uncharacterized protein n=1 Tax=Arundo donax TaxID=35708 RepID=A0A0A9DYS9_ARUDO
MLQRGLACASISFLGASCSFSTCMMITSRSGCIELVFGRSC